MSLSSVQSYTEVEQMEAAHVAARAGFTPTGRAPLATRAVRVEFDRLWLTRVDESAPQIRLVALKPTWAFNTFLTQPGAEVTVRGAAMAATAIMRHSRDHAFYEHTSGPTHWSTHVHACGRHGSSRHCHCGMRSDAAARPVDRQSVAASDDKAPPTTYRRRQLGRKRTSHDRRCRGSAQVGAIPYRGNGRLPQRCKSSRGKVGSSVTQQSCVGSAG
jgi:hypothetical protein